jgi:hypothetical protein
MVAAGNSYSDAEYQPVDDGVRKITQRRSTVGSPVSALVVS